MIKQSKKVARNKILFLKNQATLKRSQVKLLEIKNITKTKPNVWIK